MATLRPLAVEDVLRVNGCRRFAAALAAASPFASLADALLAARRIWLNEVGSPSIAESLSPALPFLPSRSTSLPVLILAAHARATAYESRST
jgi:5-hydroxyisourate hydrolase/2-oxo-4-hydroxy-4-carboxy-5-ureidoimidazoline decarboxylase